MKDKKNSALVHMQRKMLIRFIAIVGVPLVLLVGIFAGNFLYQNDVVLIGPGIQEYSLKGYPQIEDHDCDVSEAVLMRDGDRPVCYDDIVSIDWRVENNTYVVYSITFRFEEHTVSLGQDSLQPDVKFDTLIGSFLPAGFDRSKWPQPPSLGIAYDKLQMLGEKDPRQIEFSTRTDRSLVWPSVVGIEELDVVWNTLPDFPFAPDWDTDGMFGSVLVMEELVDSDVPYTQRVTSYPTQTVSISNGWTVEFTLENERFDTTLGNTEGALIRDYYGPWGGYLAQYISFDGGVTWNEWKSGVQYMLLDGKGWSIKVVRD